MSEAQTLQRSGLIIPSEPLRTCGNCKWAGTQPDLTMIECQALPPSVHIIGANQTVAGPQFDVQLMRPNLPRVLGACSLFERKAAQPA